MSEDQVRELIEATAELVGSCSGALRDETILGENVRRARDAVAGLLDAGGAAAGSATLDEIAEQRKLGWPDFHPEDYCHRCGGKNVRSWWVDSDRFNLAMGSVHQWQGIVCPGCFVALHEAATGLTCTWKLVPDTPFRHDDEATGPDAGDLRPEPGRP